MSKIYLGDSVYASKDEFGNLILTTENGIPEDPTNIIVLEPEIQLTLIRFIKGEIH